jgi:hypothetical protein
MVARPQPDRRVCVAVLDDRSRDAIRALLAACAISCVFLVLLVWTSLAYGATGDVGWHTTWNASRPGVLSTAQVVAKPAGGAYVAASLLRPSGNIDIAVLRYSAAGARMWVKYFDGPAHGIDWMTGVAVDRHGNVVVCGSSFSASGKEDWVVLKYAPNGTRRWVRTLSGAFRRADVAQAIGVAANGDVVVAGTLTRRRTGGDWCVVKYSAAGARLWRTTMTRSVAGLDQPLALAVDSADSHIYVTGRMYGTSTGDDAVTVRYRPNGRRVWWKRWDGAASGPDRGAAIAVNATGIAVAGVSGSPDSGDDGLVLRYAKNGALRWAKTVDGGQGKEGVDRFDAVGVDAGGAVVAGGSVTTDGAQGGDMLVARYLKNGAAGGWWQIAGTGPDETVLDLAVTATGRTYAAGTSAGAASPDAVVAGLASSLAPLWPAVSFDRADGEDQAQSISLAPGAVYVAGQSGNDLLVLKILR